jgi:D-amino peptidase
MTREALAAVDAARAGGATEILVADAHGNGENLLVEQFPPDVRIIRSWPRKLGMVAGIDQDVDAAIFIGYHAGTNNPTGVRAHTFSSATLARVAINGVNVTEGSWNAAIAGQFNVPVIMMSGDDAAIAEVRKAIGNIEAAETKRTLGFHSANTLTPQASYTAIGQHVAAAFKRIGDFKPYKIPGPLTVEVTFKNYLPAEVLAYLPMFERADSHSIRFHAKGHGRSLRDHELHRRVPAGSDAVSSEQAEHLRGSDDHGQTRGDGGGLCQDAPPASIGGSVVPQGQAQHADQQCPQHADQHVGARREVERREHLQSALTRGPDQPRERDGGEQHGQRRDQRAHAARDQRRDVEARRQAHHRHHCGLGRIDQRPAIEAYRSRRYKPHQHERQHDGHEQRQRDECRHFTAHCRAADIGSSSCQSSVPRWRSSALASDPTISDETTMLMAAIMAVASPRSTSGGCPSAA